MRGSVDTAVDVRSACAAGLVRMNHPAAMEELAALLADPEPAARRAAARTIAYADDRRAGSPLLRLKALSGDPEASVVAECLAGLVALSAEGAVPFVARFLGRTLAYTYEVREHVPGERLVMSTDEGPFAMETTYTWADAADGGTRMTLRNRGEPSGFAAVAGRAMAPAMRRANRRDLQRLKEALERGDGEAPGGSQNGPPVG